MHSASPRAITFLLIHNSCNYFPNCTRIHVITYTNYRTRITLGVCGLENVNNNSFLNAVLQCLSNTIPLRNRIKSGMKLYAIDNNYEKLDHIPSSYIVMVHVVKGRHYTHRCMLGPQSQRWSLRPTLDFEF